MDAMIRDNIPPRTRAAYAKHFQLEIGKPLWVCIVASCTRRVRRDYRGKGITPCLICACHAQQAWRKGHPEMAQYARLKANAKRRRKPFEITREDWLELCRITGYHNGTVGKTGDHRSSLTVDRIDHRKGYVSGNIRVITHSENSRKGAYEMEARLKSGKLVQILNEIEETENPF
jgi:hypothetical protein